MVPVSYKRNSGLFLEPETGYSQKLSFVSLILSDVSKRLIISNLINNIELHTVVHA